MEKNKTQRISLQLQELFVNACKLYFTVLVVLVNVHSSVAQTTAKEIIISGFVTDKDGGPLASALITTVSGNEYRTGNKGEFSFYLKDEAITEQSIFASYNGLVTAVRSYDPAMLNAVYNIVLYKPVKCCPRKDPDTTVTQPLPLNFKKTGIELSGENKKELDSIANILKSNPRLNVLLIAYLASSKSLQRQAELRLNNIKRYLTEQNGISTDRIEIQQMPGSNKNNNIDIKLSERQ